MRLPKISSTTFDNSSLAVTPRFGDDNDVTLDIVLEARDIQPERQEGSQAVRRRMSTGTVPQQDGGAAVLADLATWPPQKQSEKRVPVLASIPLVGGLFRTKGKSEPGREVAVFVTAHLVPESRPSR